MPPKRAPSSSKQQQQPHIRLPEAQFPDTLPHRNEEFFLSVVIGQTHMHWAMHEGFGSECKASVFWKTELTSLPELKRQYRDASDALAHHLPQLWRHYFFGGTAQESDAPSKESAWRCSWKRRIPTINVYVIGLGTSFADELQYIFSDQPARLYQLSAEHFGDTPIGTITQQEQEGDQDDQEPIQPLLPNGLEIQRRAGIKAAVSMYGHPALVMDGATFHGLWHYVATDADGTVLGGGFCANMYFTWLALHQATGGNLPLMQYSDLMEEYPLLLAPISTTNTNGATVSVAAAAAAALDTVQDAETTHEAGAPSPPPPLSVFGKSTEQAILADSLMTLAVRCRSILNHWLHRVGKAGDKESSSSPSSSDNNKKGLAVIDEDEEDMNKKPAATTPLPQQGQTAATPSTSTAPTASTTTENPESMAEVTEQQDVPPINQGTASSAAPRDDDNMEFSSDNKEPASATHTEQVNASPAAAADTTNNNTVDDDDDTTTDGKEHEKADSNGKNDTTTNETTKRNDRRHIIVTGAEKEFMIRLLQPDHGGLMEPEPGMIMPVVGQDFCIHSEKHLVVYAIGTVIYEHQLQHFEIEKKSTFEQIRRDLIGLRVAVEFGDPQPPDGDVWYRGNVVKVNRQSDEGVNWQESLEDDLYWIQFDDGDNQEMSPFELYCALLKYHELGERDLEPDQVDEGTKLRRLEKIRDSKLFAEKLKENCTMVRKELARFEADKIRREHEAERRRKEAIRRQQQEVEEAERKRVKEAEAAAAAAKAAAEAAAAAAAVVVVGEEQFDPSQNEEPLATQPPPPEYAEEKAEPPTTPQKRAATPAKAGASFIVDETTNTPSSRRSKSSTAGSTSKRGATQTTSARKRLKPDDNNDDDDGDAVPIVKAVKKVKKTDAESRSYVGLRIAKKFDDGNVYFGRVDSFSPGDPDDPDDDDFWWIHYDDGDTEQFDRQDLKAGFKLYLKKKDLDENA